MRIDGFVVYDPDGHEVDEVSPEVGRLDFCAGAIKPDAIPPDNIEKHAWAAEDYTEPFYTFVPWTPEELAEIAEAKEKAEVDRWLHEDMPVEFDAAICELYEDQEAAQAEADAALCELYELMLGGDDE